MLISVGEQGGPDLTYPDRDVTPDEKVRGVVRVIQRYFFSPSCHSDHPSALSVMVGLRRMCRGILELALALVDALTGSVPMLLFVTLISIASVIFVGGSSTPGPKGVYSTPPAGGIRMGVFTIVLTLISLPMTVIINRLVWVSLHFKASDRTSNRQGTGGGGPRKERRGGRGGGSKGSVGMAGRRRGMARRGSQRQIVRF